jgi:hypothetical protein
MRSMRSGGDEAVPSVEFERLVAISAGRLVRWHEQVHNVLHEVLLNKAKDGFVFVDLACGTAPFSEPFLMGWTAPRTASSVPRWSSLKAPSGREAVRGQVYHR